MGGQVIKTNKWWGNVPRTQESQADPVVIAPVSLDVLADQVARANNAVVHREAELARAQIHLEECQQALINRMIEVAQTSGIREFKYKPTPKRGDEE